MKLELRKFDINRIRDNCTVVLIGKRNTGKSVLVKDILSHHSSLPVGTVISPTERVNQFYGKMIPSVFIHDEFTSNIIENVRIRQEMIMKSMIKEKDTFGVTKIDPRAFLILDDCLYDESWSKDKNTKFFFMNGRHISLFFIITMQYPLGVPPNLRTNIDYVFILRENVIGNRRRIYDNYAGMFPSFDIFCQVMDQCTQNFECLVIDNTSCSTRLEDIVYWYKANPKDDFQMCNREYWILAAEHEKSNEEQDGEQLFDPSKLRKRNSPVINVRKH